jgi:hypothetical protein
MKIKNLPLVLIGILLFTSLSCNMVTGSVNKPTSPAEPPVINPGNVQPTEQTGFESTAPALPVETTPPDANTGLASEFPLPKDADQVTVIQAGMVNFRTGLTLNEVVAFYRDAFNNQGLKERGEITLINDQAISLVFDGASNGKAIIIQGFPLGNGFTNVSIRYEDV